jgi:hypothetical protein
MAVTKHVTGCQCKPCGRKARARKRKNANRTGWVALAIAAIAMGFLVVGAIEGSSAPTNSSTQVAK